MKDEYMDIMKELIMLKQGGIYCFINSDKKKIQIFGSRNIMRNLDENLEIILKSNEYPELKEDLDNVEFSILETTTNDQEIRVLLSKWNEYYINEEYKSYKEDGYTKYRLVDSFSMFDNKYYITVELRNKHKSKILIGIFKSHDEALEWKKLHYPNNKIDRLIYCNNELTTKYRIK